MIIKTNDKGIPKGFLLQKDYFLSKLFLSKKKKVIPIEARTMQPTPIETHLYLQINKRKNEENKTRNSKSINVLSNYKHRCRIRKSFLPHFSSIDFHEHYRTKECFRLQFMEDDLNITSINSKKFYYTNRENSSRIETKIKDKIDFTGLGRTTILSSFPKFNLVSFSNEKLKQITSRPHTGTSWFPTELPKTKR